MRPLQRIAIIEDDPDIRALLELSLTSLGGFDIQAYELASIAVAKLPGEPEWPQMVILDVMMPVLSGLDAIPLLRQLAGATPLCIVMITAKAAQEELAVLIQAGADFVVNKPFDPVLLPELLHHFWSEFHAGL